VGENEGKSLVKKYGFKTKMTLTLYILRIRDFKIQTLIDYTVESIMEMEFLIISLA